jgi:hypothetical protein
MVCYSVNVWWTLISSITPLSCWMKLMKGLYIQMFCLVSVHRYIVWCYYRDIYVFKFIYRQVSKCQFKPVDQDTIAKEIVFLLGKLVLIQVLKSIQGVHGSVVGWGTMLQAGRSQVQFPMWSLDFSVDLILQLHYDPGVDSASNRNEYQESSWG